METSAHCFLGGPRPDRTSGRALLLPALGFCAALCFQGCSSAPAPLAITMQHPETKQTLT